MSGQRKDLISRTNCVESTCPFSRNIIKSKNKVGRFNPWTDSAYRDSGYYELTVPDLEHIRDAHNGKNRIIRQAHLNQLIASIKKWKFLESGEAIKFGWVGYILDGQNRIHSALATLKDYETITVLVVFGIDPEINQKLPFPKPRRLQDILEEQRIDFEDWQISLLKRLCKIFKIKLDGTNIVPLFNKWVSHFNTTIAWLDKTKYIYEPSQKQPTYFQDIKSYAVLTEASREHKNNDVLDAWFNPNNKTKLAKDIKVIFNKILHTKNHPSASNKILKLLCLAHQSVNDELANQYGIHKDKKWISDVVFGVGLKELPKSNIYYKLVEDNKELWS